MQKIKGQGARTVGDGVGQGHDGDGEEGRHSLVDVVPVDLDHIDHHQGPCQDQRRACTVGGDAGCEHTEADTSILRSSYGRCLTLYSLLRLPAGIRDPVWLLLGSFCPDQKAKLCLSPGTAENTEIQDK